MPKVLRRMGARGRLPVARLRADAVERQGHRRHRRGPLARAVRRQGAGDAADLRRPGGDRDPERAPVQGDAGGPGAADGDGRDPAGDQRVARRHAAGVRGHRRHGVRLFKDAAAVAAGARRRRLSAAMADRPAGRSRSRAVGRRWCRSMRGQLPVAGDARQADAALDGLARRSNCRRTSSAAGRRRHALVADAADAAGRRVHRRARHRAHASAGAFGARRSRCCAPSPTRR